MFSLNHIKQWLKYRHWRKFLNLHQHEPLFNSLYAGVNGFELSKKARIPKDAMEYVYGEIEFLPFIALLSLVELDEHSVFYDLGSGTGKAVIACAMVYSPKKCFGIELFPSLHLCACAQKNKLLAIEEYARAAQNIEFLLGDFLERPLEEATIVFINASAFFGETWEKISNKLATCPKLKTVITTSKALKSEQFYVSKTTKVLMSWGPVMAYIHQIHNRSNSH